MNNGRSNSHKVISQKTKKENLNTMRTSSKRKYLEMIMTFMDLKTKVRMIRSTMKDMAMEAMILRMVFRQRI
jgi:hypothetical protein